MRHAGLLIGDTTSHRSKPDDALRSEITAGVSFIRRRMWTSQDTHNTIPVWHSPISLRDKTVHSDVAPNGTTGSCDILLSQRDGPHHPNVLERRAQPHHHPPITPAGRFYRVARHAGRRHPDPLDALHPAPRAQGDPQTGSGWSRRYNPPVPSADNARPGRDAPARHQREANHTDPDANAERTGHRQRPQQDPASFRDIHAATATARRHHQYPSLRDTHATTATA
jgi:hypothetical protein